MQCLLLTELASLRERRIRTKPAGHTAKPTECQPKCIKTILKQPKQHGQSFFFHLVIVF